MQIFIPIAASLLTAFTLSMFFASARKKDQLIIASARDVAECPTVNTLGALKTAIQLYDEGAL